MYEILKPKFQSLGKFCEFIENFSLFIICDPHEKMEIRFEKWCLQHFSEAKMA